LADYFDDHGTPNEQMLAYYLLGRAYHDLHESPMALKFFQIASERADTTSTDCDYAQLSRVYGQMSRVFYQQNLMRQSLNYTELEEKYAWKGNDTLNALRGLLGRVAPYKRLLMPDSAIIVCEKVSQFAFENGKRAFSAAVLGSIIRNLVDNGELTKAKSYMDKYEQMSGYFDEENQIEKGRETYYNVKGLYYLAIDKVDSAEYYFRKELKEGRDFNNQNSGSHGLALLFQKKHMPDSAAKYALYSYEMNDSVYAQMATREVEQMQAMYDYSRNQEIARISKEKAEREHVKLQIAIVVFLLLTIITVHIVIRLHRQQIEAKQKYERNVSELARTQTAVLKLRSYGEELSQMLSEKVEQASRLTREIEAYKEKVGHQKESAEVLLLQSEVYDNLKKSAIKGVLLTDEDWHQIYIMIIEIMPGFNKYISSMKFELNDKEYKTCILIRLHFIQKEIANMLGVSPAYIAKVCNHVMQKLYNITGKTKDLEKKLKQYS